jgi:hypothetical protein
MEDKLMRKIIAILFMQMCLVQFLPAESQSNSNPSKTNEKFEVIQRDQIDNTDTYAIPIDSSEVEDEQQINRNAKKQIFSIPGADKI